MSDSYNASTFDCIVAGGGHAGCEAAVALARMGHSVLLISGNSSAENGSTPLERIKAAFYRMPAHGRYLLNYHMYAPELHALSADARRR